VATTVPTHGLTRDEVRVDGLRLCEAVHQPALCIPRHEHDLLKVCILLSGSYAERDGPALHSMRPMDVMVRASRRSHANQYGASGARSLLLEIPPDHATAATLEHIDARRLASGQVMRAAVRLVHAFYDRSRNRVLFTHNAINSLLQGIVRNARVSQRPPWLEAARERLNQDFADRFVLDQLAARVRVHPVHLSHSFHLHFGQTISAYLRALRVFHATELLHSDADISTIAIDCGFYDQSHFTRAFHRERGSPPGQYRRTMGAANHGP
jgi:AraC family transcriptional regulator